MEGVEISPESIAYVTENPPATATVIEALRKFVKGEAVVDDDQAHTLAIISTLLTRRLRVTEIKRILAELNFPEDAISTLIDNWHDLLFELKPSRFPRLLDVEWLSEFSLKSKLHEHQDEYNTHIRLHLGTTDGEIEPFDFSCTQEKLAELVYTLKSACASIERLNE
mmetsp:Transcript_13298/g.24982  ORF Transcript_13298/g.24982 Transcript_13298/m.24982 type:complete len:167 (-) Transcript_13298:1639-2139(-)